MRRTFLATGLIAGLCLVALRPAQSQTEAKKQVRGASEQKKAAATSAKSDTPARAAAELGLDEAAIRTNVEAFAKAANGRDAKGIAATFTPTGEFVDGDGNVFHGRAAIEAEFDAMFKASAKGQLQITATELRAIAPGIVLEEGTATIGAGDGAATQATAATTVGYTIVHAKQTDGKWLMASVRSKGDAGVTPHDQLRQLEWLIGDWVDESDDAVVRTSTRWSDDNNFILSDFVIQLAQRGIVRGTQRIGWDASIGKFRSWVFDANGGHAEGLWTRVDDRWIVKVTGVRADGDVGTATTIYTPAGPNSFLLSSVDRVVGDAAVPNITVKVVRQPPEPKKQAAK